MIKFSLVCDEGHEFDAWFKSGAAYEAQSNSAQVACPHCGSHSTEKAIMAPAVATRGQRIETPRHEAPSFTPEQLQILRKVREEIRAKAEYVGGNFAEEARKIHFNESEPRGIYGEASADEVKELAEDGVPFLPVPQLPDDLN